MSNEPLVTIICTCFNHELFVLDALHSIENQTYKEYQVIICDNGSKDGSVDIIEMWNRDRGHLVLKNSTPIAITKGFNLAMKHARGKYILDLAADDILKPHAIASFVKEFTITNPKTDFIFCNVELIQEDGGHLGHHFSADEFGLAKEKPASGYVYEQVLATDYINSAGVMFSHALFQSLHGYDESLSYEDFDFRIRASRDTCFRYLDAVLIKKRIHPTALTHQLKSDHDMNRSSFKVSKKAYAINRNKGEYAALCHRLIHQFKIAWRNRDFLLVKDIAILYAKSFWHSRVEMTKY